MLIDIAVERHITRGMPALEGWNLGMKHIDDHLRSFTSKNGDNSRHAGLAHLRELGLGDFVHVMSRLPMNAYPELSSCLPRMTEDEICKSWTGNVAINVMEQALDFVRSCAHNYSTITGHSLVDRRILDFGCGYGRFLRCFSFFSNEVFGVDAWEASLIHARNAGYSDFVFKCDEVPSDIPVPGKFELTAAFSVFTHLSRESTLAALAALRRLAAPGGVLALTIRPVEYWALASKQNLLASDGDVSKLTHDHESKGFAFLPDGGQIHYGHTSMTVEWLRKLAIGWSVVTVDRSPKDQLQRYVFLKAV